jgi:large subunit ribosomal protein L24
MQCLKVNDEVIVLTGKDRNKTGKITKIDWKNNRIWVKGINVLKKTVRPTKENPAGGIVDKESSVHISNVAMMSPKTKKPTRIRIETRDGKKVRVASKCGSVIE